MALHYLDPRQAGTGAPYTLETRNDSPSPSVWTYRKVPSYAMWYGPYPDEQSALRAARKAAGFGHVAETACHCDVATCRLWDTDAEADNECPHCAWPRDAHRVQS